MHDHGGPGAWRPGLPVTVLSGGGRAFFTASRGQVLVSPPLGDLLTDDELDALLLQEFAAPPNAARNVWLEILSVPAALLLVFSVLSLWLDLPLYGLGFLLAVVWTVVATQHDGVRFAVASGAANKLTRAQIAGQMQKHVVLLASMGGISQPELRAIGDTAAAIPELYAPERLPTSRRVLPYSWSIYFGFIVLLVVGSVFLAMLLSRP